MTVFILGQEFIANGSALGRVFAIAAETGRFGIALVARIVRIRRDRATLYQLPDYLLRDIGIERAQIRSVTRRGGQDGPRG